MHSSLDVCWDLAYLSADAPADLQAQPLAAATWTAVSAMNLATALHAAPADVGSAPAPRGHTNATASDAPAVKVETPEPARASKIGKSVAQDKPGKKSSSEYRSCPIDIVLTSKARKTPKKSPA